MADDSSDGGSPAPVIPTGPLDPDGVGTGRGFDRFVNFSDAVVAIAITLLGLPLIDIVPPEGDQTAWQVLSANGGQLGAFAYTFWVVAALWLAHHRVLANFRGFDSALMTFNLLYLMAIVVIPFSSQWVGEEGFGDGIGTFYLLTLTAASASLGLVVWHGRRKPALLEAWARPDGAHPLSLGRSALFTAFFAAAAIVALAWPNLTSYLMIGLIPLSILQRRIDARR